MYYLLICFVRYPVHCFHLCMIWKSSHAGTCATSVIYIELEVLNAIYWNLCSRIWYVMPVLLEFLCDNYKKLQINIEKSDFNCICEHTGNRSKWYKEICLLLQSQILWNVENLLAINTHAKSLETSGRTFVVLASFIIANEDLIKKMGKINSDHNYWYSNRS